MYLKVDTKLVRSPPISQLEEPFQFNDESPVKMEK
jgi:hypothetical protein